MSIGGALGGLGEGIVQFGRVARGFTGGGSLSAVQTGHTSRVVACSEAVLYRGRQ